MWSYQHHFPGELAGVAAQVLRELDVPDGTRPRTFVVGIRRPGSQDPNEVCVQPDELPWTVAEFARLPARVQSTEENHPNRNIIYGDAARMREKPERLRLDSIRRAVKDLVGERDREDNVVTFVGRAVLVDDFYVVPVIQLAATSFRDDTVLSGTIAFGDYVGAPSLLHAAMGLVAEEASQELERDDPGRYSGQRYRRASEIALEAARSFMRSPGIALGDREFYADLFERVNQIASLFYERQGIAGRLLLVKPESSAVVYDLRFVTPVPLGAARWARKTVQMASSDTALIADCSSIHGLGSLGNEHQLGANDAFVVEFLGHHQWELHCDDKRLLRVDYGVPRVPRPALEGERFRDTFERVFPGVGAEGAQRAQRLAEAAIAVGHGCMLIYAEDAVGEAKRLDRQGATVRPTPLTPALLQRVSRIDGTIILDPLGTCHAVGVILDGPASDACTPARGSRYNSAVRYVRASSSPRLAIVISEDGTVDFVPKLRPRIRRSVAEAMVAELEGSSLDNWHRARSWVDDNRFYLDAALCDRANAALDRLEAEPLEVGRIIIHTQRLRPDPDFNESYYIREVPTQPV